MLINCHSPSVHNLAKSSHRNPIRIALMYMHIRTYIINKTQCESNAIQCLCISSTNFLLLSFSNFENFLLIKSY